MQSQTLWNDPDIRWLAGVHEYLGKTYANKELFQEVAAWLQLPALIETAQQHSDASGFKEVETTLKETYEAMQRSGYNLQTYLSSPEDSLGASPEESKKLDPPGFDPTA